MALTQVTSDVLTSNLSFSGTSTFSGNVGVNTSNIPSNKDTVTPKFIVNGAGVAGSMQIVRNTTVGAGGAILELTATRGTDVNSYTTLQSGDGIGSVTFGGSDGTQFVRAASISAQVDGAPGANDMPGRLIFATTADGASADTERMRIDNAGNVGIGTTAPGYLLEVKTNNVANQGIKIWGYSADGSKNSNIYFGDNAGTNAYVMRFVNVFGGGSGELYGLNLRSLNTSANFNVMAGTEASPVAGLTVLGTSGNVGIGTTSPAQKLQVYTGSATATYGSFGNSVNAGGMVVGADASGWAYAWNTNSAVGVSNSVYGNASSNNTGSVLFYSAAAERMRIDNSGNVGIGTTSPNIGGYGANSRILTVQGVSGSYGIAELSSNSANSDGTFVGRLDFSSSGQAANYVNVASIASVLSGSTSTKFGSTLQFYTRADNAGSGSPSERMRITSAGYVGIGTTTPQNALVVSSAGAGGVEIDPSGYISSYNRSTSAQQDLYIRALQQYFYSNGVERMRIDSAGNLLVGTTSASTPSSTGYISTANTFGFKNRIINGAMVIDQRNAGASVTPANGDYFVDRWTYGSTQASKFTAQQTTTAPSGFTNSIKMTVASAVTIGTGDIFNIDQRIEGFNAADLGWGAAGAATVTLSFWVQSSLTGTFGGSIINGTFNRSYPFTYTINSANTWEQKTVTIAGDTSGTWNKTNGLGIRVSFSLGSGSTYSGTAGTWAGAGYTSATGAVSVVGTSGATFYLTGVQLEKGSTATSFDYRPYGTELQLCQRYYSRWDSSTNAAAYASNVGGYATTAAMGIFSLPVTMRANPTLTTTGTASNYKLVLNGTSITCTSVPTIDQSNPYSLNIFWYATVTVGSVGIAGAASTTAAFLGFNAEL